MRGTGFSERNEAPPAPRLRRVTPQGAMLVARQSRFHGILEKSFLCSIWGGFGGSLSSVNLLA